ncbi:MAG: substrate-binding periplasmic protein [Thioalkalivibrio sp.]
MDATRHSLNTTTPVLTGLLLTLLLCTSAVAQTLDDIQWISEEYAPYNYTENGVPRGIAVDVLMEIWDRVGAEHRATDIQVLPWARGYRITQDQPNSCLFSTTVTDQRRTLFTFVEPVVENRIALLAPRSRGLRIESPADIAQYRIGVVRDDIGEELVVATGVDVPLVRTDSSRIMVRMLQGQRFDLIAYDEDVARWAMQLEGIDANEYEVVYVLREGVMGIACNKDTDPVLIQELQQALDALTEDGTLRRITRKYRQ